jgi:very-short-patch-repair endonuclease
MSKIHNLYSLRENRREQRLNPTPQEERLWWYLRDKRLGVKFRRQHSVGGYILDFYFSKKKLIVEVDGEIHNTQDAREYDEARDKFFTDLDYRVLRFSNTDVENNIDAVIAKIKSYL